MRVRWSRVHVLHDERWVERQSCPDNYGQSISNFSEQHGLSIREKGPTGSLSRIFSIAEDAAGNIWFGTRDNGAWRFDGKSLTNFTMKDGLTSPKVWTIYRDKRDALWFGMADGSVCRFNGESFDRIY
ncbi:MAG: two-component regulator propeller domain-containing protein [Bacteroidota bacterium]